jgi:ribosomal protein L40E/uncharacterized protein YgiM (DUF1202 family)
MKEERICPSCGKAALPVATRCPKCGYAFELRYERPRPDTSRRTSLFVGLLILVIVALVASNALRQRGAARPSEAVREAGMPAAPAQPAVDSTPAPAVSSEKPAVLAEAPAPKTTPVAVPSPATPAAKPPAAVAATIAAPKTVRSAGRRYATTWINVRSARNNRASVVRVLKPGEAVSIDSLDQGWYQVVTADRIQGYADRRLLSDAPPTPAP